ncbi:MAG: type II secretion system F family protein [Methanoregulaceae archaeon]|nr:type II secretion system F family protein [Methanoregulaceae archaeon]
MTLTVLSVLIFLVTMALVISGIYFFLEAPAEKRKLRRRMEMAKEEITRSDARTGEGSLLRAEVLSGSPIIHQFLLKVPGIRKLQLFLQQAAMDTTVGMLLTLSLLAGWVAFLAALLFNAPFLLALLFALLALSIPFLVVAVKRQRRFLKFEEQFPDAIDLLARAVRAGHAFTTGLDLIAKEMPSPLSDEFQRTYEQQNLGLPLRDAFLNLMRRMPLTDVRIFVTALMIQKESGGNLAEILDNLAAVIRERFKLMRQVRVYTAQGRLSLYLLVAVPPVMGMIVYFLNREYIMRLFTDPLGLKLLMAAILLQAMGYFVIRKIVQPKY